MNEENTHHTITIHPDHRYYLEFPITENGTTGFSVGGSHIIAALSEFFSESAKVRMNADARIDAISERLDMEERHRFEVDDAQGTALADIKTHLDEQERRLDRITLEMLDRHLNLHRSIDALSKSIQS